MPGSTYATDTNHPGPMKWRISTYHLPVGDHNDGGDDDDDDDGDGNGNGNGDGDGGELSSLFVIVEL